MTKKRRAGLGRGLDALLSLDATDSPSFGHQQTQPIENLLPGKHQPRQAIDPDNLAALADSIRSQGMIQPIAIRPISTDRYEILAGERRWRAAKLVGLTEVPVVIYDVADDTAMMIALIENIQREDLNAVEVARSIARLIETFGLTHQEVADHLGRSRSAVTNSLRLLELPDPILQSISANQLDMGHARALLPLPITDQLDLARQIVERGLSVRQVENMVRQRLEPSSKKAPTKSPPRNGDRRHLETRLSDWLGAKTALTANQKGRGKLTIAFSSFDQLDRLLTRLGLPRED